MYFLNEVNREYHDDENLKKEDIQTFLMWVNDQPHLPKINELQAVIFMKRCNYEVDVSKSVIDSYFTVKSLCPELFLKRKPSNSKLITAYNLLLYTILPKRTPDEDSIVFAKMMEPNMDLFDLDTQIKYFDMVCMLSLHQDGPSKGYQLIVDLKDFPVAILSKLDPLIMKKFIYYMQEAMPLRWTAIHYLHVVSFMDQLLNFIKPFMNKDFVNLIHLHDTVDDLTQHIPKERLPQDYGGLADSTRILQGKIKNRLLANGAFFEWEDQQIVDENKRWGKAKTINDIFGIEATFRKLQLD